MTVGVRTTGSWAAGSTSISTSFPTGIADGDMMILFVGCKPYNATITDVSGWTRLGTQQTNGTTANSTDAGSVTWTVFYRIKQTGDSAPTVSITSGNTGLAVIHAFTKTGPTWGVPTAYFGSDTSSGTGYSITAASSSGALAAGDGLVHCTILSGNNATLGTPTITATGLTVGTVTNNPSSNGSTNTGLDCAAASATALPSSGTSSADAVCGWTLSANQTGGSALVRVREDPYVDVTQTDISVTGKDIALDKQFGFTAAAPSIAGTALTIERMADIAALSVQGQTVDLDLVQGSIDFVFDQSALSTSGSTLTSDESSAVTEADLESTGQTVTFILGRNLDVTEAALSTSGQNVVGDEACVFTNASLSTQGSALVGDEAILVTSAALSTSGSTVTFNINIDCPVTAASLSALGQTVGQDVTLNFTHSALSSAGSDVTLNQGLSLNLVEASLSTQGQALDLDRAYNLGVTEASLSSSGQDLTLYPSYSLDAVEASISVVGQTLSLDLGGHKQLAVDPATDLISGSTLSFDRVLNLTQADLSVTGISVGQDKAFNYTHATLTAQGADIVGDEAAVLTQAALSTAGSALTSDESSAVVAASLTSQGQDVGLEVVGGSNTDFPFDPAALSVSGTTLTIEKMADPASLSVQGQDITLTKIVPGIINVDSADLSVTGKTVTCDKVFSFTAGSATLDGTAVTIQRMASAASLTFETSWIDLVNSMGQPTYTLDMDPATFSIVGQWVQSEQSREYDQAIFETTGQEFVWDFGILVTEAAPALAGSDVGFILYNSATVDVTPAVPEITTQDVTFSTTQVPIPDLQVEQANLSVQGVNVTLERPPLNVVAAAIEVTGQDVLLTPIGLGNVLPVDAASLAINAQDVAQVIEGSFTLNVTNANFTLDGMVVGLNKVATLGNQGKIDGFTEWVLDTDNGYAILYPKDGGYYVISS